MKRASEGGSQFSSRIIITRSVTAASVNAEPQKEEEEEEGCTSAQKAHARFIQSKAMSEVDAGRDRATPAWADDDSLSRTHLKGGRFIQSTSDDQRKKRRRVYSKSRREKEPLSHLFIVKKSPPPPGCLVRLMVWV